MSTSTSTPATIEIERLLEPISEENPSGSSLAYEPEYDKIREARRSDEALDQGDWKRDLKTSDWGQVIAVASTSLTSKTKDLQIAAWMTEALIKLHGFAGLRDGLIVMKEIQERFWETYHPQIEDRDVESRFGPFLFLNDRNRGIPFLILNVPMTQGTDGQNYTTIQFRESRETDNLIRKDPDRESEILDGGRLTSKNFDEAVSQTPKGFYARLSADLDEARAAFQAFEASTDQRFGNEAPSLLEMGKAIDECVRLVAPILAAKRLAEPDPVAHDEPPTTEQPAPRDQVEAVEGSSFVAEPVGNGDAVSIPRRRARLGTPQEGDSPDYGRVLIDSLDRVQALAEAGAKLRENREKYAELLDELRRLDDEYEELSQVVSRNRESYALLSRLLRLS